MRMLCTYVQYVQSLADVRARLRSARRCGMKRQMENKIPHARRRVDVEFTSLSRGDVRKSTPHVALACRERGARSIGLLYENVIIRN